MDKALKELNDLYKQLFDQEIIDQYNLEHQNL